MIAVAITEIEKLVSSGCSRLKHRLEATAKLCRASTAPRILPTLPWKQTESFRAAVIAEVMSNPLADSVTRREAMADAQRLINERWAKVLGYSHVEWLDSKNLRPTQAQITFHSFERVKPGEPWHAAAQRLKDDSPQIYYDEETE